MTLGTCTYHRTMAWEKGIVFLRMVMCKEFNTIRCLIVLGCVMSAPKCSTYSVRLCLTASGYVHTAYCVCPAGLAVVVATTLQHSYSHWRNLYNLVYESRVNCHAQVDSNNGTVLGAEMLHHVGLAMLQH